MIPENKGGEQRRRTEAENSGGYTNSKARNFNRPSEHLSKLNILNQPKYRVPTNTRKGIVPPSHIIMLSLILSSSSLILERSFLEKVVCAPLLVRYRTVRYLGTVLYTLREGPPAGTSLMARCQIRKVNKGNPVR